MPYHTDVPSFGDWGFIYATHPAGSPDRPVDQPGTVLPFGLSSTTPPTRYITDDVLAAATVFSPDRDRIPVKVSTLLDPAIITYAADQWVGY